MVLLPALFPKLPHLHAICSIAAFQIHGLPFACYVQHFRAATFHLQPMCSILEPYTSYKIPWYHLCATCMLSTYYLYTPMYLFPLKYDQLRIYKPLTCNPTNKYYIIFPCRYATYYIPLIAYLHTTCVLLICD